MTGDLSEQYARAIDEIYRLRGLLAYEAGVMRGHLALATFPRSRRPIAEGQITRMTRAAIGESKLALAGTDTRGMLHVRQQLGIQTLTRWQFENEQNQP